MWKIKQINELSGLEFYGMLQLRINTFVVEQKRIYKELDENDLTATHIFYQSEESNQVLAYARVFKQDNHITFGRVVTSSDVRGTGLGSKLITQILDFCDKTWPGKEIKIESQQQVIGFYKKFGFVELSEPFILEGTPHVEMSLKK
ncbi:GNAT family N-acetyltransferase [Fructilactobacillus frigidiflavus]|uniref:GNAT family N-acetyltransferase n=1 Tax=Fructilactobacillus frigidiflavus TaxID=3242688 RepID=UPI0037580D4B